MAALLLVPRWPCLLPLGLLGLWGIWKRRWGVLLVDVASLWVALFGIMGAHWSMFPRENEPTALRVLSCNVHRRVLNAEALQAYIAMVEPDIVALQDWTSVHSETLFAGEQWHVRRLGELFVASRYPIASVTPIDLGLDASIAPGEQGEAALFTVDAPGGSVSIINLHLASPHVGLLAVAKDGGAALATNVRRRWLESNRVRACAAGVVGHLLVVGDFNTTPDSPIATEHWSGLQDSFAVCGSGLGYTYFNGHARLRIDRVLANEFVEPIRCRVGPFVGSPHRPLVVDFRRLSGAPSPGRLN
jgi:endonuclease/exonuclease/phosphatase (EEP) superfamily protein YafD